MPLVDLNGLGYFKGKENAMIADNYSATATYKQGDFCYYNGTLKKAKQDIDTAEAWTSAHWEDAVLGEELTSVKNALTVNNLNVANIVLQNYFNVFNKENLIANKGYKNSGEVVDSTEASITGLIPLSKAVTYTKLRTNLPFAKALMFNGNGTVLSTVGNGAYAIDIAENARYAAFTFYNTTDFDSLMIAYSNDTESNWGNTKWDTVFPDLQYLAYGVEPVADEEKFTWEYMSQVIGNMTGATLATDANTGKKYLAITGSSSNVTWYTAVKQCRELTTYVLEFNGKTSTVDISDSTSDGAFLVLEFLDVNGIIIGTKYNGYVLGENSRGYHRYTYVSPVGAESIRLRIVTRANTNIELENVSVKEVSDVTARNFSGLKIDAHLGVTTIAPENTIIGYTLAGVSGFGAAITNVNVTSDGVLVALHDDTIDDTSDGTGNVSDFTYEELQAYDFGSYFNAVYTGTRIPTFESVLQTIASYGMKLTVSLHNNLTQAQLDDMCALIKKYGFAENCMIKSETMSELQYVYSVLGNDVEYGYGVSTGLITTSIVDTIVAFQGKMSFEFGMNFLNSYDETLQTAIDYAHENDVPLSFFAGTDMASARRAYLLGITRITSDAGANVIFPVT